jgi:hypothetical protein
LSRPRRAFRPDGGSILVHDFQCHSNETEWPWYSNIAPASWLIAFDVIEGRQTFNFSDWGNNPGELDELIENIQSGEMPPIQYWVAHPNARLTDAKSKPSSRVCKPHLVNNLI